MLSKDFSSCGQTLGTHERSLKRFIIRISWTNEIFWPYSLDFLSVCVCKLSKSVCLLVIVFVCLFVCLLVRLLVCAFFVYQCLSFSFASVGLFCLFVCLFLFICLSVCMLVCLFVRVCVLVCLSVCFVCLSVSVLVC